MKKLLWLVFLLMSCQHATDDGIKKPQLTTIGDELQLKRGNFPFQLADVNRL